MALPGLVFHVSDLVTVMTPGSTAASRRMPISAGPKVVVVALLTGRMTVGLSEYFTSYAPMSQRKSLRGKPRMSVAGHWAGWPASMRGEFRGKGLA